MTIKVGPFCRKGLSPQGEHRVQQATGYRTGTLVDVQTDRGKPQNPARQAGPTEPRSYSLATTISQIASKLRLEAATMHGKAELRLPDLFSIARSDCLKATRHEPKPTTIFESFQPEPCWSGHVSHADGRTSAGEWDGGR
jgi:hypothetical protein